MRGLRCVLRPGACPPARSSLDDAICTHAPRAARARSCTAEAAPASCTRRRVLRFLASLTWWTSPCLCGRSCLCPCEDRFDLVDSTCPVPCVHCADAACGPAPGCGGGPGGTRHAAGVAAHKRASVQLCAEHVRAQRMLHVDATGGVSGAMNKSRSNLFVTIGASQPVVHVRPKHKYKYKYKIYL